MIAYACEAPLSLMEYIKKNTDYDYALVHLFEENPEYFSFFKKSLSEGREVILDNSVFELGDHFDEELYKKWILELKPTYFIIPDRFLDKKYTVDKVREWYTWAEKNKLRCIGVLQGKNVEEFVEAYTQIEPLVDIVAISFAQKCFQDLFPMLPVDEARMYGRITVMDILEKRGIINKRKKHHLLGLALPQELLHYKGKNWITSVDSSSPVLHGYLNIAFEPFGLLQKDTLKIDEIFLEKTEMNTTIKKNLEIFKGFCS